MDNATQNYLLSFRPELVTKDAVIALFGRTATRDLNGRTAVAPPLIYPYDPMILRKSALKNLKADVQTTAGLFFFNMYFIESIFGDLIPYVNEEMSAKNFKRLLRTISNLLLEDKVTVQQWATFQERVTWFENFQEVLSPGVTQSVVNPPKGVRELKKKLIKENQETIKSNDVVKYTRDVSNPLMAAAKEALKDDPAFQLYQVGGKPKFENSFKNSGLEKGPILDITTGEYQISTASFLEGIPPEEHHLYANDAILASYNRGVATQEAGARTKQIFAAMQNVRLDKEGYDCGTPFLLTVHLTPENKNKYLYRYIKHGGELILLDPGAIDAFVGEAVAMRSPLFCFSDNVCHHCAGEMFTKLGIENMGLATTKVSSVLLNLSLKAMHDTTLSIKSYKVDNYIREIE